MPIHKPLLSKYKEFLPVGKNTPLITLGEGGTPLVRSSNIGPTLGCKDLYFKLEGCNPTGSFKDRGMVLAVAKALEKDKKKIVCASTGNTSASASAYGARYGLESIIIVPSIEIALGKIVQAMAYGAKIIAIEGNFDQALSIVRSIVKKMDIELVNSINPYRIEGQKTGSFEIIDELGNNPDILCIPVGNAGNITAYWNGFKEYYEIGNSKSLPKMMGFQASGSAPIVKGTKIENPETLATAIRIGNPASWQGALKAKDESNGLIDMVTDEEIIQSYLKLTREEGIFCEPASAASLAGLIRLVNAGEDISNKTVVCVLTGNGLKDPETVQKKSGAKIETIDPDIEKIFELLDD